MNTELVMTSFTLGGSLIESAIVPNEPTDVMLADRRVVLEEMLIEETIQ